MLFLTALLLVRWKRGSARHGYIIPPVDSPTSPHQRFPLGQLVATPGALVAFERTGQQPIEFLSRHATGDWGDLGPDDKSANDQAVESGERLLSAYRLKDGTKIWVITEADRSVTTALLPTEY
jgi:hypothetical protein